jgi:hypothetical protein
VGLKLKMGGRRDLLPGNSNLFFNLRKERRRKPWAKRDRGLEDIS